MNPSPYEQFQAALTLGDEAKAQEIIRANPDLISLNTLEENQIPSAVLETMYRVDTHDKYQGLSDEQAEELAKQGSVMMDPQVIAEHVIDKGQYEAAYAILNDCPDIAEENGPVLIDSALRAAERSVREQQEQGGETPEVDMVAEGVVALLAEQRPSDFTPEDIAQVQELGIRDVDIDRIQEMQGSVMFLSPEEVERMTDQDLADAGASPDYIDKLEASRSIEDPER